MKEQTEKQGRRENREISGNDDASREEIRETETKRRNKKERGREREGELKWIIYLSGINRKAYRMERI